MTDGAAALARRRLRYTWRPFFSRFGRLTEVQIQAVPKVLDGINVVVTAPTASGKTEAVVGPVAERCMTERWDGLSVVYIVPTRALANDTLERIEGPLRDMGLITVLKHGDKPQLPTKTPNWLITTPESLDSLICRRPELFTTLRTIILDEIHLLDNTYRGDQLRLLLLRLRSLTSHPPLATHLLSATLADADDVAKHYTDQYDLIMVKGQREIEYYLLPSHEAIRDLARNNGWKKLLYFCNKRASVETVAAELHELWKPYPVVAHHGSLDRKVREAAEREMKESRAAVGVATSTLEIGIDIGDIDLVVLAEPPWSIAALLQRVGRGKRRANKIYVAALAVSDAERMIMRSMFETASEGTLVREPYKPDLSVVVQQTLSFVFQHRAGIAESDLVKLLMHLCAEETARIIVEHLRQKGWIERRGRTLHPTTKLMDEAEKGNIHSNVPNSGNLRVIDVESGQEVGTINGVFDETFLLARQAWQIVSIEHGMVRVRKYRGKAHMTLFSRQHNRGSFHRELPPSLI